MWWNSIQVRSATSLFQEVKSNTCLLLLCQKKNKPWGGCFSILWFLKPIAPSVVYFEPSVPRSSLLSEGWIYIKNVILRVFHMTRKLPLIMIKRNYSTQFKIFCYSLQFCFTSYTKCRYIVKHRIPQDEPKPHETSQNHPLL